MSNFSAQWSQIQLGWVQNRVPQSMLFVGALDCTLVDFIQNLMLLFFCKKKENQPCRECNDCKMTACNEHPDIIWIKPEKSGGAIKIDQIRELQNYAYLTPQRASQRLIIIESADRMNTAAANSLLKILEEPASHTRFLLISQQLGTVLPTVLSRCQVMRFSSHQDLATLNLLNSGARYRQESEQAMIINQSETILDGLISVLEKKAHPCVIAAQWNQFELGTLLWFIYLVYAQVQMMQINRQTVKGTASNQLTKLVLLLDSVQIFAQIDKINILQRKLNHNMNVNHTLVLEDFLLSL